MEQWVAPDCGTLRIINPKTLEKWIHNGNYQKQLNRGYYFGLGCGRFRTEVCICSACRKHPKKELELVILKHYKL